MVDGGAGADSAGTTGRGETDSGMGTPNEPDASTEMPADSGVDACVKRVCGQAGTACGLVEDGCGGMLDCSDCGPGYVCDAQNECELVDECAGPRAGALVCEGFESGLSEYSVDLMAGSLTTSNAEVYDGNNALHAHTNTSNAWARASRTIPDVTSGSLFFRVYFYTPAGDITDRLKIFAFEPNPNAVNIDVALEDNLAVGAFFQNGQIAVNSAGGVVQTDTWQCLQGELVLHDTLGGMHLLLDDVSVLDTERIYDTLPDTGIGTVYFGLHWADFAESASDLYMDDLVVDTSPIPCL
jgi:hypothetical protein